MSVLVSFSFYPHGRNDIDDDLSCTYTTAGKSIRDNLMGDVPGAVKCFQYHAEAIDKVYDQIAPTANNALGLIVREPVGVVGLIVPWNFPLLMAVWKLAPALACGNSVVLKPAESTSLSALKLGNLATQAGLPPGVLNIVPGYGHVVGAAMAAHMDIDMIGFTGSTVTGRKILAAAAISNLKRVSLELGGKSPQVVFDDCDLETAIPHILFAAFWNQSENCSCGSRLIVQRGIKEELLQKLIVAAQAYQIGDPLLLSSDGGSMISPDHLQKVLSYIQSAHEEGARCLLGGQQVLAETGGSYVGLTIFDNVAPTMKIATEEIFGPVLSVMEFETEEQAIKLANDTIYGLAASLYTSNVHRALRVSRRIRAGTVSVNCYSEGDDSTPFGGYKLSGFGGRDKSVFAHEQYQEIKTIWHHIADT
jgi:4-(gamma-glutamylamino)butanal dehydrogenase